MKYFVYIKGLLGVETNMKKFAWSYGMVAPEAEQEDFNCCKIKVSIVSKKDHEVFPAEEISAAQGKFSYFSGNYGAHTLYYEKNFLFGKKLRYRIAVHGNLIQVVVGESYMRFVPLRMMNLHAMHYILSDLVSGLLLMNGYASMYCSAASFPKEKRSMLIFSAPGMGKSITCLRLCQQHHADFVAEDIAVTDGETVWAVPWTSSYRVYDEKQVSGLEKVLHKIRRIVPVLDLFRGIQQHSVEELLGPGRIAEQAKISDVILLERGQHRIGMDSEDAERRLLLLNRYLFNYHKSPCMIALSYFNQEFSPEQMYLAEKKIVKKLLKNAEFQCIYQENPLNYSEMIFQEILKK